MIIIASLSGCIRSTQMSISLNIIGLIPHCVHRWLGTIGGLIQEVGTLRATGSLLILGASPARVSISKEGILLLR
jgi:hypothetical protein